MIECKTPVEKGIEDKFYKIWERRKDNLNYGRTSHDLALFYFKKAYTLSAKAERDDER